MKSILVDAGPLIALFDGSDAHHAGVRDLIRDVPAQRIGSTSGTCIWNDRRSRRAHPRPQRFAPRPGTECSACTPRARRKLEYVEIASGLDDLRIPPGNRLHQLGADREGQHAIRINDQWRICFRFEDGDAYEVEITDYH